MIAERVASPEAVGFSPARLQHVDRVFQSFVERGIIAGAVAFVARNGQVALLNAYGFMDLESRRPMERDAIFRLASMTKPVVGVAILMLFEEGKLLLNQPVADFIPEFRDLQVAVPNPRGMPGVATQLKVGDFHLEPAERDITIRDLLNHTSGLGSATVGPGAMSALGVVQSSPRGKRLADVVPSMAAPPLSFQPGSAWEYSAAFGFDVLGRIVEIVSGQTLNDFFRERIFEPLGMRDTHFHVPADKASRMPVVYDRGTGVLQPGQQIPWLTPDDPDGTYYAGCGGLAGTAEDYGRLGIALADGGRLGEVRLLNRRTVELMASNHIGNLPLDRAMNDMRGYRFGLSVRVLDNPVDAVAIASRGTFGWSGAYGTHSWIDPVERLVGVMLVQRSPDPNDTTLRSLSPRFQAAAYQALDD